MQMNDIFLF